MYFFLFLPPVRPLTYFILTPPTGKSLNKYISLALCSQCQHTELSQLSYRNMKGGKEVRMKGRKEIRTPSAVVSLFCLLFLIILTLEMLSGTQKWNIMKRAGPATLVRV